MKLPRNFSPYRSPPDDPQTDPDTAHLDLDRRETVPLPMDWKGRKAGNQTNSISYQFVIARWNGNGRRPHERPAHGLK